MEHSLLACANGCAALMAYLPILAAPIRAVEKSAYGHPLANQRFETFNIAHLARIGFTPLLSTPSVYVLGNNGERLTLGSIMTTLS